MDAFVIVMPEGTYPIRWMDQQAVATLPECIDKSNADQVREQFEQPCASPELA